MKVKQTLGAVLLTAFIPALTGCIGVRIRLVQKTVIADHIQDATLDQLIAATEARYKAIQTITSTVSVVASSGGEHAGEQKEYPSLSGYILLRKPGDLEVLLKVPLVGSRAMIMVSDGKDFKLLIPLKHRAIVGADDTTDTSKKGLESLRPSIIRDALLIPSLGPDDFVALTAGSRREKSATKKNETIEEPDYDISILRRKQGIQLERIRVIHVSRITLLPYEQDLYDHDGRIVTTVSYNNYQKHGDIDFPSDIFIQRPLDELTVRITIEKVTFNEKLDDEQFTLPIPEGTAIEKM